VLVHKVLYRPLLWWVLQSLKGFRNEDDQSTYCEGIAGRFAGMHDEHHTCGRFMPASHQHDYPRLIGHLYDDSKENDTG
jgi:hypothetical protein